MKLFVGMQTHANKEVVVCFFDLREWKASGEVPLQDETSTRQVDSNWSIGRSVWVQHGQPQSVEVPARNTRKWKLTWPKTKHMCRIRNSRSSSGWPLKTAARARSQDCNAALQHRRLHTRGPRASTSSAQFIHDRSPVQLGMILLWKVVHSTYNWEGQGVKRTADNVGTSM